MKLIEILQMKLRTKRTNLFSHYTMVLHIIIYHCIKYKFIFFSRYANGDIHIGHIDLKDVVLRYKLLAGYQVKTAMVCQLN